MCNSLYINDDLCIHTAGELAAFVGPENVLQYAGETEAVEIADQDDLREHPKTCLCWLAVPETLERLGYKVESDGMDWIASR